MAMNFSSLFSEYVEEPLEEYFAEPSSQGVFLTLFEMSLSLIGTVLNLIVLIPILEIEELSNSTMNILMANLSLGNLVSTVFVKLVGVVYHGYALAAQRWDISIPFCTVYTVTSRISWAIFPFTIVAIIGIGLTKRGIEILTFWEASKRRKKSSFRRLSKSRSRNSNQSSDNSAEDLDFEEDFEEEGFTKIQKGALAFVWASSSIYALLTDKMLSKEQKDEVICSMREDLNDKLNIISVLMIIAFPILTLILWPIGHFLLDTLSCLKGIVIMSARKEVNLLSESSNNCCGDESDSCIETILIFGFTIIFLVVYPTSMLITEFYFAETETMFAFMLLKYCLGSMTLVLSPCCVLVIKRDIRTAAKDIYMKRTAKADDGLNISLKDLVMKLEELKDGKDDDKLSETELRRMLEFQMK